MKMKPIAMAAISGLVIALAAMPAMADDSEMGQTMQGDVTATDSQSSTDNATMQTQNNTSAQNETATSSNNTDEGNPDTPTGDDY